MRKQGNRWLGILLALCMTAGMLPVTVLAEATADVSSLADGTVARGTYVDAEGNTRNYLVEFDKPLPTTGGYLEPGNYYLTDDIDLGGCLKTSTFESGTVRIDLAGHILRRSGGTSGAIEMAQSFDLELYDSDANEGNPDRAVHYYTADENGLWVFDDTNTSGNVWYGGVITGATGGRNGAVAVVGNTFTMYGGTISGNVSENVGGVGISGVNSSLHGSTYGKFVMNGGYIVGNCATSLQEQNYGGGGVNAMGLSTFEMNGGEISDNVAEGCGGGVFLDRGATFIMNRGKISENSSKRDAAYWGGGGVYVYSDSLSKQDTVFTMNGGEISGNISYGSGGGVYLKSDASSDFFAKMTMTGGIIRGNRAEGTEVLYGRASGSGGGVHADNVRSAFTMSGGKISENHARNFGGGLYSDGEVLDLSKSVTIADNTAGSGTEKAQNVYLTFRAKITASEPLTNSGEIGIAMQKPGIFTSGWKTTMGGADPQNHFVSEVENYKVAWKDEEGALVAAHKATFVADEVTVGTVTFAEGETTLTEPTVPAKAHYDGAWESYDLVAAKGDITVNAIYTQNNDHTGCETAVVTPPTCVEEGYTTYTCSVCGNVRRGDETKALGHDYQLNADRSEPATPGHDGFDYYECTRCGDFYKSPIAAPIVTHTATFQIGDEIIDQVVFEEGSATLEEPPIPERPNYIGQWESYDLASATTDITVQGHYVPMDPDKVSDVEGEAGAEYQNGVVTMTLSAKADTRTIKVISQKTKPLDVVLVLDQSGSMADSLTNWGRQSKRDALVDCANSFVQSLYENAVNSGADHRVALVGFAYSAYNRGGYGYKNTGLLTTSNGKSVQYDRIEGSDLCSALMPINNGGSINANVLSGIGSIRADGATAADLGLRMARDIFAANPNETERERVVIFITDGTPTCWGEDALLVRQTGAAAITVADTIKNGQNAKIYSVGVHADADPAAGFTAAKDGIVTDGRGNFKSYDFNRFLHAVSSNYPNAAAMDDLGAGDQNGGYYMGVRDTENLGSIFTNILYSTVYELKTFDRATLSYTLTKEFTLTMEQETTLRERLQREQGMADADIQIQRNDDGTTQLTFRNVKVKEVYEEDGTISYEAVVQFDVSANDKTLAGGTISTGTGGASYGDSSVTHIGEAFVTIPVDRSVIAFTINGQVYRICDMTQGDQIVVPETELAAWTVPDGATAEAGYATFEANSSQTREYTIVWSIDGQKIIQKYALGEKIVPPEVTAKAGYDFTGWSRTIPYTMPAYDLVCEAIYSPVHNHSFELAYRTGSCKTGLTSVLRCACGETRTETAPPQEHSFTAVLADNGSAETMIERVVCTKCGHSEEQNIRFKVSYSSGYKTTVLDLNLLQNEVSVTQPKEEIEMRFYVGDDGGRRYTVTRIDSDGRRTKYQTRSENGYLVFRANHFSIYVLSEVDETTSQPAEEVNYGEALDILASKEEAKPAAPIEGGQQSGGGSNVPSTYRPTVEQPKEGGTVTTSPAAPRKGDTVTISPKPDEGYEVDKITVTDRNGKSVEVKKNPDGTFSFTQPSGKVKIEVSYQPTQPAEPWSNPFTDVVKDAWYYGAVEYAVARGLFNGTSDNAFSPNETMTRAMLMTVLARLDGQDTEDGDIWYAKGMAWAVARGVSDGTAPEAPITREQLAAMVYRYAKAGKPSGDLTGFVDADSVSTWATDAVTWAVEQGIIHGKGGGVLDPKGQATRAEVATMLMRYCELEK